MEPIQIWNDFFKCHQDERAHNMFGVPYGKCNEQEQFMVLHSVDNMYRHYIEMYA